MKEFRSTAIQVYVIICVCVSVFHTLYRYVGAEGLDKEGHYPVSSGCKDPSKAHWVMAALCMRGQKASTTFKPKPCMRLWGLPTAGCLDLKVS